MTHFNKSELKGRGWTDAGIKRFLGEPDHFHDNPHYRSGPSVCHYLGDRVVEIEASMEFREWRAQSEKRRERARRAAKTREAALLDRMTKLDIVLPDKELDEVRAAAIESYNAYRQENRIDYYASMGSDADFLDRITVNFIRHELTHYEVTINRLSGKVGKEEGVALLREKIFYAIGRKYPKLYSECQRQTEERVNS